MKKYSSRYPRNGRVAILCEGDLAGYEVDLLELWTAQFPDVGLVDVWPCGTKTAIYGLADAIGRAIPLIVIEDRDHRTIEAAQKSCRGNLKDRQGRAVKVNAWRTWARSEIENYLIEPSVLLPVFAEVFSTEEAVVAKALQDVLTNTAIDQALQYSLSLFRSEFPHGDRDVSGVSRKDGRPNWKDGQFLVPDQEKVAGLLAEVLGKSLRKLDPDARPQHDIFMKLFATKCDEWRGMLLENDAWQVDWAGKEILAWLRIKMTSDFGWFDPSGSGNRIPIDWEKLTRNESGAMDRAIEEVLQPRLTKRFLKQLSDTGSYAPSIVKEWQEIIEDLRK